MDFVMNLLQQAFEQVLLSLLHNWPFLLASIAVAALLKLFVDGRRISAFLSRHRKAGIGVATGVG